MADAPLNASLLDQVVSLRQRCGAGEYDHVEVVLEAPALPCQAVDPDQLWRLTLRPEQLARRRPPRPGRLVPAFGGTAAVAAFVERLRNRHFWVSFSLS